MRSRVVGVQRALSLIRAKPAHNIAWGAEARISKGPVLWNFFFLSNEIRRQRSSEFASLSCPSGWSWNNHWYYDGAQSTQVSPFSRTAESDVRKSHG
jgi:hypothetical protein